MYLRTLNAIPDIVSYLRALGWGDIHPKRLRGGIATQLSLMWEDDRDTITPDVMGLAKEWPGYSGDWRDPIPREYNGTPRDEFGRVVNEWVGERGMYQRELCLFLADKLEEYGRKNDEAARDVQIRVHQIKSPKM